MTQSNEHSDAMREAEYKRVTSENAMLRDALSRLASPVSMTGECRITTEEESARMRYAQTYSTATMGLSTAPTEHSDAMRDQVIGQATITINRQKYESMKAAIAHERKLADELAEALQTADYELRYHGGSVTQRATALAKHQAARGTK